MEKIISVLNSRWFQFVIIPVAVFVWFVVTDPSNGADTMMRVQMWAQALLVTGLAYLIAKAMLGKASSEALYEKSIEGVTSAGIAYLGVCLMRVLVLFSLLMFFAQVQG